MTKDLRRENEELRRRLVEAEQTIQALTAGQIDAIVDEAHEVPLLLHEAQEALRVSEERFRTMVTTAAEGIWTLDAQVRTTFVNERMAAMLGYGTEEMLGRSMFDFMDEEARSAAVRSFDQQEIGLRKERDFPFRRKDGSIIWTRLSTRHLFGSGGELLGGIGMAVDITERRRAEENLRVTQAALQQAQALAHIGSWSSDPLHPGKLIWSAEMLRIFGLPPDGFDGRFETFMAMVHPEDLPALQVADAACWRDGRSLSIDHRIVRPDGTIRWINDSAEVVRDASGKTVGLVGIAQDITDLRVANDRLRESEERYRLLFDASPLPILLFDPERLAVAAVNEAASLLYGYAREEFLSKTLPDLLPPEDVEATIALIGSTTEWRGIRQHVKRGGGLITVELDGHKVVLADRTYLLVVLRNITSQLELESQLRQSQKLEAVGQLAGGVAHDFNNILTVILGYCDVLLDRLGPGDSGRQELLEVRQAGGRAAGLTRQLLAFSRKQKLAPESLDLGDLVHSLLAMVQRLIGENIEVSIAAPSGLWRVEADRGQMEQVVMNLAINSRDAMTKGGRLVLELQNVELDEAQARTREELRPGSYVLLSVSDTGTGMDPETQKRVFEPFFTTKERGKGTGLGLSTVYGIVHQSGGSVRVSSEPGRGTTFEVYLPRLGEAVEAPRLPSGAHPAPSTGAEKILLVEDEEAIRELAKIVLEAGGYTVLLAADPAAAERIASDHQGSIHLLITDVVMPGMDGLTLADRLVRLRPDLRVMFMSGYTDDVLAAHHRALAAGTSFLQKPFTPHQLMLKVREVFDSDPSGGR